MASRRERQNALLVVCDTLRPDFLSPYGGRVETPFFDRLADAGTVRDTPDVVNRYLSDEMVARLRYGLKSVQTDDYLFTRDSAGEERLYARPDETEIPLSDGPVDELRAMLHETLGEDFPPGTQAEEEMGEAVESNLRKLGYIE